MFEVYRESQNLTPHRIKTNLHIAKKNGTVEKGDIIQQLFDM